MTTPSSSVAPATSAAPDLAAIRDRQQATWALGDYAVIGNTIVLVAEQLCEAADLAAGSRVLDVATGSGNAALAAAHRFCDVTGTDYVPSLLARGRARAAAEGLPIDFREADAERQPFPDASFDAVLSVFGAMFTPDPEKTAAELLRVCRPGGRIALANWTPDGFIGRMFKTVGRFVAPPPGLRPPAQWGTRERIEELFGKGAARIATTPRLFTFRFRSAADFVSIFRRWYGPTIQAFAKLDEAGRANLERELLALIAEFDRGTGGTMAAPAEYLEVVIDRR